MDLRYLKHCLLFGLAFHLFQYYNWEYGWATSMLLDSFIQISFALFILGCFADVVFSKFIKWTKYVYFLSIFAFLYGIYYTISFLPFRFSMGPTTSLFPSIPYLKQIAVVTLACLPLGLIAIFLDWITSKMKLGLNLRTF